MKDYLITENTRVDDDGNFKEVLFKKGDKVISTDLTIIGTVAGLHSKRARCVVEDEQGKPLLHIMNTDYWVLYP